MPKDVWSYVNDSTVYIVRTHPFLAPYDAGAAFEFVYPAIDPIVLGLGFAATRDVMSFLRHDASTDNPLGNRIRYAISRRAISERADGRGTSSIGDSTRIWAERKVFEGMMPRIAGSHRIALNARFGDPDATGWSYTRQLLGKMEFPFTYEVRTDPITGRTDGIFARCEVTGTCPNVMQLDTGNEGWLKALNLVTQDGLGNDIELPDNVRAYYFASTQHGMGEPGEAPQFSALCQQMQNPVSDRPHIRALIKALDEWATEGFLPPESRWPRSSDGTFVPSLPQGERRLPEDPGGDVHRMVCACLGKRFNPAFRLGLFLERNTWFWCRRRMPTGTISRGFAPLRFKCRWRPIPDGPSGVRHTRRMRNAARRASRSPSP